VEGITVDVCQGGCGGIWFDAHELQHINEPFAFNTEALLSIQKMPGIALIQRGKRSCPRCKDVFLMRHFFSRKRKVEIDDCPGCGGIWLDAGELAQIRDELPPMEARKEEISQRNIRLVYQYLLKIRIESSSQQEVDQ
jgi:Zn-finger nucleic acid-binding protein